MEKGKDIYSALKKNNIAVISIATISLISVLAMCYTTFAIYKESQKNIYAISETGNLVPLTKLEDKEDKIKQVKANLDYFVSLYYDLDAYTMKDKKEKLYWLVGTQPTAIMKDRDRKGYFNKFLSINGLTQHAKINQKTWRLSGYDAPYTVSFEVFVTVINGNTIENYVNSVSVVVEETNRNYPFNPYGLLITKLSENLQKVKVENEFNAEKEQIEAINQNN